MLNKQSDNEILNLQDLLVDEKTNELSEYLSLSIENQGNNTQVSVTTVEDNPTTYSVTLHDVSISDLQYLRDDSTESII